MSVVEVLTGSRLHFGLILGTAETHWRFGGVGLMVRRPGWHLVLATDRRTTDHINTTGETQRRISKLLVALRTAFPLPPVEIQVKASIPAHTGLGGGTQLALAVAAAAELLVARRPLSDPGRLAQLTGRAERSAIGTIGFRCGGFLVDNGQPVDAPLISQHRVRRLTIPDDWRFVLIRPSDAEGFSGDNERSYFARPSAMSGSLVASLAELIEQRLTPAVESSDFTEFAAALEAYGNLTGSWYAAEQGGVFAHPAIRELVQRLHSDDIPGAAQSSWGPGICVPAESATEAERIARLIPKMVGNQRLLVEISEPLNTGATIRSPAPIEHPGIIL